MRSGYIVFTLVVISMTLTSVITVAMVSEFGIESERNIFVRFLLKKLGMWAFSVLNISGVLGFYFILTMLRKSDVRLASSFLLTIMLLGISDLAHDAIALVTHHSIFSSSIFFLLALDFAFLSLFLFYMEELPPLEF